MSYGKTKNFVRVIDLPDGSLERSEKKNQGREIYGLSFNKSNSRYYTIDQASSKRVYHGADLREAIAAAAGYDPLDSSTWSEQHWDEWKTRSNTQVEIDRTIQDLNQVELYRVISSTTQQSLQPSKKRLSDCYTFWADWMLDVEPET